MNTELHDRHGRHVRKTQQVYWEPFMENVSTSSEEEVTATERIKGWATGDILPQSTKGTRPRTHCILTQSPRTLGSGYKKWQAGPDENDVTLRTSRGRPRADRCNRYWWDEQSTDSLSKIFSSSRLPLRRCRHCRGPLSVKPRDDCEEGPKDEQQFVKYSDQQQQCDSPISCIEGLLRDWLVSYFYCTWPIYNRLGPSDGFYLAVAIKTKGTTFTWHGYVSSINRLRTRWMSEKYLMTQGP